jgi:hypothetical protein
VRLVQAVFAAGDLGVLFTPPELAADASAFVLVVSLCAELAAIRVSALRRRSRAQAVCHRGGGEFYSDHELRCCCHRRCAASTRTSGLEWSLATSLDHFRCPALLFHAAFVRDGVLVVSGDLDGCCCASGRLLTRPICLRELRAKCTRVFCCVER